MPGVRTEWITFGRDRLYQVTLTREYVEHYHRERNHQGLENRLLQHGAPPHRTATNVQRRGRLGGLLNFYHREAA